MASNHGYTPDLGDDIERKSYQNNVPHAQMKHRDSDTCKRFCCIQLFSVLIFALGVTGGIFIGIYAYHGGPDGDKDNTKCPTNQFQQSGGNAQASPQPTQPPHTQAPAEEAPSCPRPNPVKDSSYEKSIYAPLTTGEMDRVANYLLTQGVISTLQAPENLMHNFILYQSIKPPKKSEAVHYLDNGGPKPSRYAKVTVQRGLATPPDVMEYKVGPLDANSGTGITHSEITKPGDIAFNSRPYEFIEVSQMYNLLGPALATLEPMIKESFDGATFPGDLYIDFFNGPPTTDGKTRNTRWILGFKGFQDEADVDLIHLLPLSGTIRNSGSNASTWYADDFHYLNQGPYATASELLDAYNKDAIRKVKLPKGFKYTLWDRIFPKRDDNKPLRENADMPGPRAYEPAGPRYEIRGTNVKWMGWNFDISGGQTRGPALFNIKFKNERIIYELAVNDIALNYAMDSHAQNNIIYADATYGIMGGDTPTNIMSGVDCPEHGTVLNTSYWSSTTQQSYDMRTLCIFEADGQEPLWRHVGTTFEAGMRNRYLVVRVPVVIGNYDYIFEFNFYLDGKIFTFAKASGYIQASFWDEHNPHTNDKSRDAFGYRLSDFATGPVHDHMFGFKVDFDIIDQNNTFQLVKWKAGPALEALQTQTNIASAPSYFIYNETRYVEWEKVAKETGIDSPQDQAFMLVVNEKEKNQWGVERGYQIAPLETGSQSLKTHPLLKALSFTKYHCAVTKRKEEEPTLTSIYDINRMESPKSYLDLHLNGEDIVDEDIVNWVTVGFLHIPTSEDMPMTVRVQTGFLLRPFNFFDRTESFDMPEYASTASKTHSEQDASHKPCLDNAEQYCRFC